MSYKEGFFQEVDDYIHNTTPLRQLDGLANLYWYGQSMLHHDPKSNTTLIKDPIFGALTLWRSQGNSPLNKAVSGGFKKWTDFALKNPMAGKALRGVGHGLNAYGLASMGLMAGSMIEGVLKPKPNQFNIPIQTAPMQMKLSGLDSIRKMVGVIPTVANRVLGMNPKNLVNVGGKGIEEAGKLTRFFSKPAITSDAGKILSRGDVLKGMGVVGTSLMTPRFTPRRTSNIGLQNFSNQPAQGLKKLGTLAPAKNLRKANKEEIPFIFKLCMKNKDAFDLNDEASIAYAKDRLSSQNTLVWGDLFKDTFKGFINYGHRAVPTIGENALYFRFIYVNPRNRGQGVAEKMIKEVLKSNRGAFWMQIAEVNKSMQRVAGRLKMQKISVLDHNGIKIGVWYGKY